MARIFLLVSFRVGKKLLRYKLDSRVFSTDVSSNRSLLPPALSQSSLVLFLLGLEGPGSLVSLKISLSMN